MCVVVRIWMWKRADGGCKMGNNDNEQIGKREGSERQGGRNKGEDEIKGEETRRKKRKGREIKPRADM